MIYKNKRRELEELRLELGENIEDEELQGIYIYIYII